MHRRRRAYAPRSMRGRIRKKKIGSVRYLLLHMASDEDSMHVSGRGGGPTHFQTYKIIEKKHLENKTTQNNHANLVCALEVLTIRICLVCTCKGGLKLRHTFRSTSLRQMRDYQHSIIIANFLFCEAHVQELALNAHS